MNHRPLKILNIVPYFPPAYFFGGPVKLVYEISKELINRGHKAAVLTTDVLDRQNRSGLNFFENMEGIDVYRVKNLSNYLASHHNLYVSFELKKFFDLNLDFDVVHYHDFRSVNNYFLSKHFAEKNIKQFMSPYGGMSRIEKRFAKNIFDFIFGKTIIGNINIFFAVNNIEKKYIKKFTGKTNVEILPNHIDVKNSQPIAKYDIREELNLPRDKKIILFFSRLHPMKNPGFTIEVYNKLPDEIKRQSILLIAGPDDGAVDECKKLVQKYNLDKHVFIIAKTIGDEKWNLYDEASVLILPTTDQAFPLVQLEALSMNTPVVTTEKALEKYLKNDFGAVVEFQAESFVDEITRIIRDNIKPANSDVFVKKNYSTEVYCEKLVKYYYIKPR